MFQTTNQTAILTSDLGLQHLEVVVSGELFGQVESLPLVVLHQDQCKIILALQSAGTGWTFLVIHWEVFFRFKL